MRRTSRARPRIRRLQQPPAGLDLGILASRVSYVGSPEHKDAPSFAGQPRPRADASICGIEFNTMQDEITAWIRRAVEAGIVGGPWEGHFPRYVWVKHEGVLYEARLVNRDNGEYKGYPLDAHEWPEGV